MPCDTAAVTLDANDGSRYVVFLKNSDRHPNEPQLVEVHAERERPPGATLRTTYATIPQVRHTLAVCISRPERMWGAEMGVNASGLCVGNEAVFSSLVPIVTENHQVLTGMDLVRLCLERCRGAAECVDLVAALADKWPVGGNCGLDDQHPFYYHNGFVFSDASGRKVTMILLGREWLAVDHSDAVGAVTLSNSVASVRSTLSHSAALRGSTGMLAMLRAGGLRLDAKRGTSTTASKVLAGALLQLVGRGYPWLCDYFANGRERAGCTLRSLAALCRGGDRPTRDAMILQCFSALRQHNCCTSERPVGWLARLLNTQKQFWLRNDVCMHAGPGPVRLTSTTNAMVVEVRVRSDATTSSVRDAFEGVRVWSTLSSNPCLTPFKPIHLGGRRAELHSLSSCPLFSAQWSALEWWWRVERVHRSLHRQWRVASGVDSVDTRALAELRDWVDEMERQHVSAANDSPFHPAAPYCLVAPRVLACEDDFYRHHAGMAAVQERDRSGASAPLWMLVLRLVSSPLAVLFGMSYPIV